MGLAIPCARKGQRFIEPRHREGIGIIQRPGHTDQAMTIAIGFYHREYATARRALAYSLKIVAQCGEIDMGRDGPRHEKPRPE